VRQAKIVGFGLLPAAFASLAIPSKKIVRRLAKRQSTTISLPDFQFGGW
jgi:hypothetical protein